MKELNNSIEISYNRLLGCEITYYDKVYMVEQINPEGHMIIRPKVELKQDSITLTLEEYQELCKIKDEYDVHKPYIKKLEIHNQVYFEKLMELYNKKG